MTPGLLDETKSVLRSLIISCPHGMTIERLNRDYREMEGRSIPYSQLGYNKLEAFLRSLTDTLVVSGVGFNAMVTAITTEKTAHIDKMVTKQKNSTRRSAIARTTESRDRNNYQRSSRPDSRQPARPTSGHNYQPRNTNTNNTSNHQIQNTMSNRPLMPPLYPHPPTQAFQQGYNHAYYNAQPTHSIRNLQSHPLYPTQQLNNIASWQMIQNAIVMAQQYNLKQVYNTQLSHRAYTACTSSTIATTQQSQSNSNGQRQQSATNQQKTQPDSNQPQANSNGQPTQTSTNQQNPASQNRSSTASDSITAGSASSPSEGTLLANTSKSALVSSLNYEQHNGNTDYYDDDALEDISNEYLMELDKTMASLNIKTKDKIVQSNEKKKEMPKQTDSKQAVVKKRTEKKQVEVDALPELAKNDLVFQLDFPIDTVQYGESIPPSKLPKSLLEASWFGIFITEIHNPYRFWFHYPDDSNELDKLMHYIENTYTQLNQDQMKLKPSCCKPGQVCCALYAGLWHRAVILEEPENENIRVSFVDYGTVSSIPVNDLKFLLSEFVSLPCQAHRGTLAHIRPVKHRWSREATYAFLDMVADLHLYAKATEIDETEKIVSMILTDTNKKVDFQINEALVRKGHAKIDIESLPSSSPEQPQQPRSKHFQQVYPSFTMLENGEYPSFTEMTTMLSNGLDVEGLLDENIIAEQYYLKNEMDEYTKKLVSHNVIRPTQNTETELSKQSTIHLTKDEQKELNEIIAGKVSISTDCDDNFTKNVDDLNVTSHNQKVNNVTSRNQQTVVTESHSLKTVTNDLSPDEQKDLLHSIRNGVPNSSDSVISNNISSESQNINPFVVPPWYTANATNQPTVDNNNSNMSIPVHLTNGSVTNWKATNPFLWDSFEQQMRQEQVMPSPPNVINTVPVNMQLYNNYHTNMPTCQGTMQNMPDIVQHQPANQPMIGIAMGGMVVPYSMAPIYGNTINYSSGYSVPAVNMQPVSAKIPRPPPGFENCIPQKKNHFSVN